MRKFLKKRWHGIPVGIISAMLITCLLAGGALAAYQFFTATVNVEVEEPFTFGVNYVGWEAPSGADMAGGYYSQLSPLTCSVALMVGESSNGNPDVDMPEREQLPCLTIGEEPCPRDVYHGYHTFNSMQVANDAGVPIKVSFTVTGETSKVYMVTWDEGIVQKLNGYTQEVPAGGFIIRGIGAVADAGAAPGSHTLTIKVSRS